MKESPLVRDLGIERVRRPNAAKFPWKSRAREPRCGSSCFELQEGVAMAMERPQYGGLKRQGNVVKHAISELMEATWMGCHGGLTMRNLMNKVLKEMKELAAEEVCNC
eukprot:c25295_g3_i1 orf=607-930(+)